MPIIGNFSSAGKKPTTPTIGTATDGGTGTTASVAFTPSTYIGKSTITYTALSNPGSITGTGAASPITVSGLTTGTAYTFTVKGDTNYGVASDYSAASNSVTPASPSSFESIATVTVSGTSTTTITFSSIPSTYKSLQIRGIYRKLLTGGFGPNFQFNNDTAGNYTNHYLNGSSSATASNSTGDSYFDGPPGPSGSQAASIFGAIIVDIIDYSTTSKYKTIRSIGGVNNDGPGNIRLNSSLWLSTNAISTITITNGTDVFEAGTTYALYGVK